MNNEVIFVYFRFLYQNSHIDYLSACPSILRNATLLSPSVIRNWPGDERKDCWGRVRRNYSLYYSSLVKNHLKMHCWTIKRSWKTFVSWFSNCDWRKGDAQRAVLCVNELKNRCAQRTGAMRGQYRLTVDCCAAIHPPFCMA